MAPAPLTLGTAGHIDHGKTTLIRALTGVDTDRLPEERRRGISIELGYAALELPSGRTLSVVDVPGHERFVRTMVAGATGIDLYLMTIAADDGVMPQTREHAAVLAGLEVRQGVVAMTKCDLADPAPAMLEARELFPGTEVVEVSARSGVGLANLLAALERAAAATPGRIADAGPARLNVDRVFTIRGAGTVATGPLWSGAIARGEEVEILPQGLRTRVRGVQVHDQQVELALPGQRVALNLTGVAVADVSRGDVIASAGSGLAASYRLDCRLEFGEKDPMHGERVQIHHGTRESPARLAWLGGRFWQLRLEQPLVAAAGDRLVLRRIAPPDTLGGGVVLDRTPRKHGPSRELLVRLGALSRGEAPPAGGDDPPLRGRPGREPAPAAEPAPAPAPTESQLALELRLREAKLEPPLDSELDPGELSALRATGRAVRVSQTLHYHPDALAEVRKRVREIAARSGGTVTLAQLRDELGTSRKFARALLAYLDAERVTIRRGDAHYLRKGSSSPSAD